MEDQVREAFRFANALALALEGVNRMTFMEDKTKGARYARWPLRCAALPKKS